MLWSTGTCITHESIKLSTDMYLHCIFLKYMLSGTINKLRHWFLFQHSHSRRYLNTLFKEVDSLTCDKFAKNMKHFKGIYPTLLNTRICKE
jgi:hypothetical protein